ncbi:hypothetical protein SAMN02745129_2036 [Ferrimonas marina]|uniref:Uncharacterized protein n=1 Tax=Ferrimonas marina TaxID=299255 RepID=A0A1M5T844_9GAMM|nr:hypothetical protein SAMN02745129_2036 [Ferrimonas marina]
MIALLVLPYLFNPVMSLPVITLLCLAASGQLNTLALQTPWAIELSTWIVYPFRAGGVGSLYTPQIEVMSALSLILGAGFWLAILTPPGRAFWRKRLRYVLNPGAGRVPS